MTRIPRKICLRLKRHIFLNCIVLLSIAGTLGLYGYALDLEPVPRTMGEMGGRDIGTYVEVEGLIKDLDFGTFDVRFTLTDIQTSAFLGVSMSNEAYEKHEERETIFPGAKVGIRGQVEDYRGRLWIRMSSPDSLTVLEHADRNKMRIADLVSSPDMFEGMTVNVSGIIRDQCVIEDKKRIEVSDGKSRQWVYIESGNEIPSGYVDIYGTLLYNDLKGRWEIMLGSDGEDRVLQSGSPGPSGYQEISLDYLGAWENLSGENVKLKGVIVSRRSELVGTKFTLLEQGDFSTYSVNCFIYGVNITEDNPDIRDRTAVSVVGTFCYYEKGGYWQLSPDKIEDIYNGGRHNGLIKN